MFIHTKPSQSCESRPADIVIESQAKRLASRFRLIGARQIKTWHTLLAILFVAGFATAIVFGVYTDIYQKSGAQMQPVVQPPIRSAVMGSIQKLLSRTSTSMDELQVPLTSRFAFEPGEIIVKFRSEQHVSVARSLYQNGLSSQASQRIPALSRIVSQTGVRVSSLEPVFRGLYQQAHDRKQDERLLQQQIIQSRGGNLSKAPVNLHHVYRVVLSDMKGQDLTGIAARLSGDPDVEYAQPNYLMEATQGGSDIDLGFPLPPDDPYYASSGSWGQPYEDLWGLKKIKAEGAWAVTRGENVIVAVVDTGLDYLHPEIAGSVWTNQGEVPGNGIDDDGNGYVDDIRGWDFANHDNNPMDGHGHGTHVSGTIVAVGNNSVGIIGVAPKAKVMPVKGLRDDGSGSSGNLADAIIYAAGNGAQVINNSWGCSFCPRNPVIEDAIRFAYALDAVIVFSAGNSRTDVAFSSPQNMNETVTVAASSETDEPVFFTNFGARVDVVAPGGGSYVPPPVFDPYRNVLSLKSSQASSGMTGDGQLMVGGDYMRQAGTSMAAPHVSGVAALVRSLHPEFSNEQVRQVLRKSADDVGSAGWDLYSGYGRVNAHQALTIDKSLEVRILQPSKPQSFARYTTLTKPIDIIGTVVGGHNQTFQLYYGRGVTPNTWMPIGARGSDDARNVVLKKSWYPYGEKGLITLKLEATVGTRTFEDRVIVLVDPNWQPNWPVENGVPMTELVPLAANGASYSAVSYFDYSAGYRVSVLNKDGRSIPGWPKSVWGWPLDVAVGDINGDGADDVIVSTACYNSCQPGVSKLYAWTHGGTLLLEKDLLQEGYFVPEHIALAQLDDDPGREIIVRSWFFTGSPFVYLPTSAWNIDGTTVPGWNGLDLSGNNFGFSVFNIDNDPYDEIIMHHAEGSTEDFTASIKVINHEGRVIQSWGGIETGNVLWSSPMIIDLNGDGDKEVIAALAIYNGGYIFDLEGNKIGAWESAARPPAVYPTVAAGDVDGDGKLEIIVSYLADDNQNGILDHRIEVRGADGALRWSRVVANDQSSAYTIHERDVAIGDIDQDGREEIITYDTEGFVYVLDHAGQDKPGWPREVNSYIGRPSNSPSLVDIDGDFTLEVTVPSYGGYFAWDPAGEVAPEKPRPSWPVSRFDTQRTSNAGYYKPPEPVCVQFSFPGGNNAWNLVSLPVVPEDRSLQSVFPGAISAFGWDYAGGKYQNVNTLEPGRGYWVMMLNTSSPEVCGAPFESYSVNYTNPGWDMIGSVSGPAALVDTPPGNVVTMISFDPLTMNYVLVDPLETEPGKGYWIAVYDAPGSITVGGSTPAAASAVAPSVTPSAQKETWTVPLSITRGENRDAVAFGVAPNASDGYDRGLDRMTPPPGFSGIRSFFMSTDQKAPQLSRDFRSDAQATLTWSLIVTGTQGNPGTLAWDTSAFPSQGKLTLLQSSNGASIDMRTVREARFTGDQRFTITFETSNRLPSMPSKLYQNVGREGSSTTSKTPSFTFTIADFDQGQKIGYQIQVARDVNFTSLARDYTWTGSTTNPNSVRFDIRKEHALSKGYYWWRVRGTDELGGLSDWAYFGDRNEADFRVK